MLHLRRVERTPLRIKDTQPFGGHPSQALQHSDVFAAGSMIIPDQGSAGVSIRPNHPEGMDRTQVKGKHAVIFQKDDGLLRAPLRQCQMLRTFHHTVRDRVVFGLVKQSQKEPGCEQTLAGLRDPLLTDQSSGKCFRQNLIRIPAVQVAAFIDRHRRAVHGILRDMVVKMKIRDGPAVRNHMPLESPGSTKDSLKERPAAAGRLPVHPVIAAHDSLHVRLLHQAAECRKIGFRHILRIRFGIKAVADCLRSGMHRKMLRACRGLKVFAISLKPPDKSDPQRSSQVGILTVGFLPSPPSGIAEDVDIRRPEGKALVDIPVAECTVSIVFRASLCRDHITDLPQQLFIKGCPHSHRLGKAGCRTCPGNAVQTLVPPVIGRDSQTCDLRRIIPELAHFFSNRHFRHERTGPPSCIFSIHPHTSAHIVSLFHCNKPHPCRRAGL